MQHRHLSDNTMAKKQRQFPEKEPQPPAEQRVLPMQLKLGDRLADASGEYEVIGGGETNRRRVMDSAEAAAELSRLVQGAKLLRLYRERTGQTVKDMEELARWVSDHPEVKALEPSREDVEGIERNRPDLVRIARTGRENP
jgi:hypothetical protein